MTMSVLDKVKEKYPLPSVNDAWKILRADDEFFESIMEAVASGQSVSTFARALGLSATRMSSWLSTLKDEAKVVRYEEARRCRAAMMADRILDVCDQVETGLISPQMARIIVDNLKWIAARLDPNIWGDKIQIKGEIKTTTEMHLEAVRELSKRVKNRDDRTVIEGELDPTFLLS
jgi:DNA-binding transcriptional ArsR family regulator